MLKDKHTGGLHVGKITDEIMPARVRQSQMSYRQSYRGGPFKNL
jgi:hypothetical protein